MARSTRQPRARGGEPAPGGGVARSLLSSTAVHGAVLGLGCLLGAGVALRAAESPGARHEVTATFRAPAPTFAADEAAEHAEAVAAEEPLPEPELVPVEPEFTPEYAAEAAFAPVPEHIVERSDFAPTVDFAPRVEEPVVAASEPPADPPALRTHADPAPGILAPPIPLTAPDPEYPRLALRRGEEGTVLCRLHVDALGSVTSVEIEESSGSERLDEAARTTLATWTFAPGTLDGAPSASIYRHRVRFEYGVRHTPIG